MGVLWLALETPLDPLGDTSSQTAHMLQHVLLGVVSPPLLLLGLSAPMAGFLARRVPLLRAACEPLPAQVVAALVMIGWHVPALYQLTAANEAVHVLEHMTFVAAGVTLWWPVLEATAGTVRARLGPGWRIVYLLAATVPQDGVALALQFSRQLFYPQYATAPELLRGWTPVVDQNVSGALLMVVGKVSFALALLVIFRRWMGAGGEGSGFDTDRALIAP